MRLSRLKIDTHMKLFFACATHAGQSRMREQFRVTLKTPLCFYMSHVVFGTKEKNDTSPVLIIDIVEGAKASDAFRPETKCKQTAMDLPSVTSAIFLIAK
jgi:hypothetical protein